MPTPPPKYAPGLPPSVVQHGLRLSIIEGALSNIHITLTAGVFVTGLALMLGAGDLALGVISALPFAGQLFQFVGAYLEDRLGRRRELVLATAISGRVLWALIAILPFLTFLGFIRLPIFLLVLACSQALLGIAANGWMSWMGDLVPAAQRGRFFGIRNTITSFTAMISAWLAGLALDHYHAQGNPAIGYALVYGVGVLCALAGGAVLRRQPEPPIQPHQRLSVIELFRIPLANRRFRILIMGACGWSLATGIAAPFFNAYGLQTLQLSFAALALMGVITSATTLVTQPLIGHLQDRYGDKHVLIASIIGVVWLPWNWVIATPTFLAPVWINAVLSGIFWPGIIQGLVNLQIDRAPTEGRGAYVAAYGALTGVATLVASVLGGMLATRMGGLILQIGPVTINHYAILFILSSLGRALMGVVFARRL